MDEFKKRTIYQQGMKAFYENGGRYSNPFAANTEAFNLFERGWTQALKRHRGSIDELPQGSYNQRSGGGSMAEKYRNMRDWSRKDED